MPKYWYKIVDENNLIINSMEEIMLQTALKAAIAKGFKKINKNTIEMTLSTLVKNDTTCVIINKGDTIRVDIAIIGSYEEYTLFFRGSRKIMNMDELTSEEKMDLVLTEHDQYKLLSGLFLI